MTFLQIVNLIKDTALAQPNVNTVVREFLDLNREDTKYSAVVIQDRDGTRDRIIEQDYVTYTWHLGYVDRLTYDEGNRDDIFSTGINVINNIVNSIRNTYFPTLEVSVIDRFNTFNQRFTASCAGVYVVLAINVPVSECVDGEQADMYDSFSVKLTDNGTYHFTPDGKPVDEIDITVDVSGGGQKPEESLVETITSNGSYSYTPTPGSVYDSVALSVDVHPTERMRKTYSSNGIYGEEGDFNSATITVSVPEKVLKPYSSYYDCSPTGDNISLDPADLSADGFSSVDIEVNVMTTDIIDTLTSNGNYRYTVNDSTVGDAYIRSVDITVSVSSSQKPEESLVETITSNGSYSYTPTPGSVYDSVALSVDVHPSNSLSRTYTTNGTKSISGEFNGGTINVNVHPSVSLVETITSNGTTSFSGEWKDATISVSVSTYEEETVNYMFGHTGSRDKVFYYDGSDRGDYSAIISALPSGWTSKNLKPVPANDEIIYVSYISERLTPTSLADMGLNLVSNTYYGYYGVLKFDGTVTKTPTQFFYQCKDLMSVTLPSTCTYISALSFSESGLIEINMGNNVTVIHMFAFADCFALVSHHRISMACDRIGIGAYSGCTALQTITIRPDTTVLDPGAFEDCIHLVKVIVQATVPPVLELSSVQTYTQFDNNAPGRKIYVPVGTLQTYQNAPGWSYYASDIIEIQ